VRIEQPAPPEGVVPPAIAGVPADPVGGREPPRKVIHIAVSVAAAAIAWELPGSFTRVIFLGVLLLALAAELVRRVHARSGTIFHRAFGAMLRVREHRGITGATSLAAGFTLVVWIVPHPFAAAGILMAGLADAGAALVGRRFGRRRLRTGKSLEGSFACFAIALAIALFFPLIRPPLALAAALVIMLVEMLPIPVDDNVVLPLTAAVTLWTGAALLV